MGSLGFAETFPKYGVGMVRVGLGTSREVVEMAYSIFRFDSISFAVVASDSSISHFIDYTEGYNFAVKVQEHLHLPYQLFADGLQMRNPFIVQFRV